MSFLETAYNYFLNTIFGISNPIKRAIIKTECLVHKYINIQALAILKNDKYVSEYDLLINYMEYINIGAEWADKDYKSSNHFYHPYKKKGLYGRSNSMILGKKYYNKAINLWKKGDSKNSMVLLGAALHIIQDMTIPQHANIRLLDNHRQYETFVKKTYNHVNDFKINRGAYILDTIEEYIKFNARIALKIHKKFKDIIADEERFFNITKCTLPLAKRTTAGAMVMFCKDIST